MEAGSKADTPDEPFILSPLLHSPCGEKDTVGEILDKVVKDSSELLPMKQKQARRQRTDLWWPRQREVGEGWTARSALAGTNSNCGLVFYVVLLTAEYEFIKT